VVVCIGKRMRAVGRGTSGGGGGGGRHGGPPASSDVENDVRYVVHFSLALPYLDNLQRRSDHGTARQGTLTSDPGPQVTVMHPLTSTQWEALSGVTARSIASWLDAQCMAPWVKVVRLSWRPALLAPALYSCPRAATA